MIELLNLDLVLRAKQEAMQNTVVHKTWYGHGHIGRSGSYGIVSSVSRLVLQHLCQLL